TYAILAVYQPDLDAWNVYGTDITGAKVVEKFPDRNPNPVLRASPDGALIYANAAASVLTRSLGTALGELLPADLFAQIRDRLDSGSTAPIRVAGEGRIYRLDPVLIPEFRFINLYGTDITATEAMTAFPDENPNPVLRIDRAGTLVYANPASQPVMAALDAEVGQAMTEDVLRHLRAIAAGPPPNTLHAEWGGRVYELRVVTLSQFESLNVYGSDVTAAREVERLLLNILPASIAQRLQHGESMIADRFEEMAVLFADVVDFTPFSAQRPPAEVVGVLNEVFTIFDRLADRYDLEKIKTIGDAYMVAGGITPEGGGVEQVADMALEMIDAMRDYRTAAGATLQIRAGLHVGPAVAGIIGLKKFIYDIWGDTVNTASRLESHGLPGRIQVTSETAERLAAGYLFEPRGTVEIKGKGPVDACFLVARR
ncbi:MAG TPA: adenylate/guanylate cyclase domain-containing protein, partial [Candidatus Limnocylindria bacterium]|nr:adenylate/guanylate cyclase domain-containing protein [Candidatus Limnocylindria bacterium]